RWREASRSERSPPAGEAEHLADRIAILAHGRLRALGTAGALMAQAGTATFEEAFVALAGNAGQD
ncbi:MAG TPA: hypothetical protein IAB50_07410, partial [Candidatus Faecivicinus avistercoris]|nr:hypothetical protein [Candidatus Faecivicinus avistercoris]